MDVSIAVEAGILTKYDPTSQRYECAVCSKIGFGDVMPHMASPQHKNSAAWDIIHAKTPNEAMLSFLPETVREAKINDDIEAVDRNVFSYQCKICIGKRPFNGLTPLESHLCGIDHHKNKSKRAMNITMKLKYDSSPIPSYSSTPKNHQFSSPSESVSAGYAHEGGAKSKRNQSWPQKTLPDSLQPPPASRGNPIGGTVLLRSSPTSYSQEECFPQEVVDALKSNIVVEKEKTGSWTSYFCRACNVPLTGLKPLMQHLDSVKHQRRVNGSQLLPQNSPGPSNESSGTDVHDFGTHYSLSASAAEALKSGVVEERDCGYFCKVCNVPLTGPMPLNQHAESEKHRKKAMFELNRNMSKLMVQEASDPQVKDNSEWQLNQLNKPIRKVSDSEIINSWQHQRNQYQKVQPRYIWRISNKYLEMKCCKLITICLVMTALTRAEEDSPSNPGEVTTNSNNRTKRLDVSDFMKRGGKLAVKAAAKLGKKTKDKAGKVGKNVKDTAEDFKDKADVKDNVDDVKEKLKKVKDKGQKAKETGEKAAGKAIDTVEKLTDQAVEKVKLVKGSSDNLEELDIHLNVGQPELMALKQRAAETKGPVGSDDFDEGKGKPDDDAFPLSGTGLRSRAKDDTRPTESSADTMSTTVKPTTKNRNTSVPQSTDDEVTAVPENSPQEANDGCHSSISVVAILCSSLVSMLFL